MKSSALCCARGQIIFCKVLLSRLILEIPLAYKISFISSFIDYLYQGRWAWVLFYVKFLKELLHFGNTKFNTIYNNIIIFLSSGSCARKGGREEGCPPWALGAETSFCTLSEVQRLPPAPTGLCGAQKLGYRGGCSRMLPGQRWYLPGKGKCCR